MLRLVGRMYCCVAAGWTTAPLEGRAVVAGAVVRDGCVVPGTACLVDGAFFAGAAVLGADGAFVFAPARVVVVRVPVLCLVSGADEVAAAEESEDEDEEETAEDADEEELETASGRPFMLYCAPWSS